jgi:HSP20 family protein
MNPGSYSEVWEHYETVPEHFDFTFVRFTQDLSRALRGGCFIPQVDIKETADLYILTMSIPGIRVDELDIAVTDHDLVLKGSRAERITGLVNYHYKERHSGSIKTSVHLPTAVTSEEMKVSYKKGVLTIFLKKIIV